MTEPQFIARTGVQTPQDRTDMRTVLVALISPVVFALVYFFWLALDEPPLPILALMICISSFVIGVAAAASIAHSRGAPTPIAMVIGILAVPCLLIGASIFVIACAFMLGGLIDSIF
ncbi:MAG: hypothetical protein ACSLFF_08315 [Solirubrobacterales bacterium]